MKIIKAYLVISLVFTFAFTQAQQSFKIITQVVDSYPVLSPDGSRIAFGSNRTGVYQIFTSSPDGDDIKQLTNTVQTNSSPVWSPDGKLLVFASERDDDVEIYIMNADGSKQKRLTNQPGDDSHPKFSPDGKMIIFCSNKSTPDLTVPWIQQYSEIFTMDLNGQNMKQITTLESVATYPSFSPDMSKIAFRLITKEEGLNWSLDPISLNSEVFVMNSDGSGLVNLSRNKAYDGWPFWMPDSKTVVFSSNRGGLKDQGQLYSSKIDGKEIIKITEPGESFIQASITNDGKTIYAQRNWESSSYEYGHIVTISLK